MHLIEPIRAPMVRCMTKHDLDLSPDSYRSPMLKRRISARVRDAVRLRVEKGYKCEDAARAAGLSSAGYYKAMNQPHVKAYAEAVKLAYVERIQADKAILRAEALEVARDLLHNSPSDQVKARMVEFLAGEAKSGPSVNVQINNNSGGYEFVRPGQRVVEIEPEPDTASGGDDA